MSEKIEKIGKYIVEKKIGQGANGAVYRAYDPDNQRIVAIKTIREDILRSTENIQRKNNIIERFKREAKFIQKIKSDNIVEIYEYSESETQAFIAMEFLDGKELKSLFDENYQFSIDEIVDLQTQLLKALKATHDQKIIHRDIKPANLVLLSNGILKLTDFGIARALKDAYDDDDPELAKELTALGVVIGTPNYMSPEQIQAQPLDPRSDLFSAGVIFYQFLTGQKPFTGNNIDTLSHSIREYSPKLPSELNVNIPSNFDFVAQKAIAKKPLYRYQNAQDFIDALTSAYSGDFNKDDHIDSYKYDVEDIDSDGIDALIDMLDLDLSPVNISKL